MKTQVIGVVGRGVPLELIEAAGARPVRLSGVVGADTGESDLLLGRGIDPLAGALLAGLLAERFRPYRALVFANDSEASLRLFFVLRELARVDPAAGVPPLHLIDVMHLPRPASRTYTRAEFGRLADLLVEWTGTSIDAARLAESIREREEARTALAVARPGLRGTAFLGLRLRLDREPVASVLAEPAGARAADRDADDRPRVILSGSDQDEPGVTAAIEAAGVRVVGDDHPGGELGLGLVAEHRTIDALADRYSADGPTPHRASPAERADHLAALVTERAADAVLVYVRRFDDAPLWDVARQRDRVSVPVVVIADQDYGRIDGDELRRAIDEMRMGAEHG